MKDGFDLIVEHANRRLGWVRRDIDRMCEGAKERISREIDNEIIRARVKTNDWRDQLEMIVLKSPHEYLNKIRVA